MYGNQQLQYGYGGGHFGGGYGSGYDGQQLGGDLYPEIGGILEIGGGMDPQTAFMAANQGWHGLGAYPEVGYYDIGAAPGGMAPMVFQQGTPYGYAAPGIRPPAAAMPVRPSPLGGLRLMDKEPRTERVLWMGFKSTAAINAGANANVVSNPQDTFSPRKVIVPATVAPNFEIADLKIGAVSQLSSSDPLPAECFIPDSVATDVRFDTAQISQQINFNVNNISAAAATFRAAINGFVVRL